MRITSPNSFSFRLASLLLVLPAPALAQDSAPATIATTGYHPGQTSGLAYELGYQATLIDQNLFRFRSPYAGTNSLQSRNENEKSDTYTLFAGVRLAPGFEVYLNPEMARGNGISEALGLAGYTNGDVIRNPSLGMEPYTARCFARVTLSTGHGTESVDESENQIAGTRPTHRLVLTAGKLGTNDIFDTNRYASSTRTQFMNWALINNGAYDYAADTRGYSKGAALEWVNPGFALRLGRFAMPRVANGPDLSQNLMRNFGDQMEIEVHPRIVRKQAGIVRMLAYRNVAAMGSYDQALLAGGKPDVTTTRQPGRVKYGFGLNFEQPLADGSETGIFGRFGWDDGATESFAYTEIDRTVCLGLQVSGARWRRKQDRWALALVKNDLASKHRNYLAAGGLGFILGDGALNYGSEMILETYYNYHAAKGLTLGLDYQAIANPGYNRDRGPVSVLSFRTHLEF